MKVFKLFFLTVATVLSLSQAHAQYRLVKSDIPIIDKMTAKHRGQSLSLAKLDDIIQSIAQDGLYQVVVLESIGNNKVVIRAEQSAKIVQVQFVGNESYDRSELLEKMKVKEGAILSELEIQQAITSIEDLYKSSGYYNFRIKYRKQEMKQGFKLLINIDERNYCVIEEISIFSKNDYLNKQTLQVIEQFQNKNYKQTTSKDIEKELNNLLLDQRFLTAKVQNTATIFNKDKTRVKLKFNIQNATQFEFIFHGNEYFSHFDLIKQSEIGSKFLYISDSSSEITETIRDLYLQNGFPEATITNTQQYFSNQNKKVFVFKIKEGPRIRIGKLNIFGKISRERSHYTNIFYDHLANEAHSVYFVKKDIESAAEKMITTLKRSGHLQAELLSLNFDYSNHRNAEINLQIDEGILTYVRQILFRGAKSYPNPKLRKQVQLEPNKPLDIGEVEKSFDRLELFYKEQGFLEFKIKNKNANVIQYNPGQPYADIVYEVTEGPQIQVQDIRISGNTKTKDYVVIRELDFKKGEILSLSKVSNSIERLERIGLFGKVNIKSMDEGSKKTKRIIVVEVEERKPGLFSSGLGVFNDGILAFRGYLGTLYNNLGGKARALGGRVDLTYRPQIQYLENRLSVTYYEPYLSEDRLRGRVSLVRDQRLLNQQERQIISSNNVTIATEQEFNNQLRLTYNIWNFSNQEFFEAGSSTTDNTINIGATGPILELDYRNDEFLPTSGTYTRIELEYADPILGSSRDNPSVTGFNSQGAFNDVDAEINYFKTYFSTTHYMPLSKDHKWVWANSIRGGYLRNVSSRSDSGIPRVRSFFLGGSSTIRGFSFGPNESVPGLRELCIGQNFITAGQANDDGTGRPICSLDDIYIRDDSAFFLLKSELRFPISGAFGGLVFYDGGAVYLGDFSLDDPFRDAVGFGFKYDTPVGSFVIQLGYKLDRKKGGLGTKYDKESQVAFHLSIGTF